MLYDRIHTFLTRAGRIPKRDVARHNPITSLLVKPRQTVLFGTVTEALEAIRFAALVVLRRTSLITVTGYPIVALFGFMRAVVLRLNMSWIAFLEGQRGTLNSPHWPSRRYTDGESEQKCTE